MDKLMDEIQELKNRIIELEKFVKTLQDTTQITYDTEQAFRTRLRIDKYTTIESTSKSATSENKAVNEAGTSIYEVLGKPDGFAKILLNNTVWNIPLYD